jgi:hypothetical protein
MTTATRKKALAAAFVASPAGSPASTTWPRRSTRFRSTPRTGRGREPCSPSWWPSTGNSAPRVGGFARLPMRSSDWRYSPA